jgi:hypothetical protein
MLQNRTADARQCARFGRTYFTTEHTEITSRKLRLPHLAREELEENATKNQSM